MTQTRTSPVTIKLLNSDEQILNLWPIDSGYRIAIKNLKGEVYIVSVCLDENQMPRLESEPEILITHKDRATLPEITTEIQNPEGKIKITTF